MLVNADCLEFLPTLESGSIDFICTDLPYGTTPAHWDKQLPMKDLWREYNRVLKPNGACCLFATPPFSFLLYQSNPKDYRYSWYWKKEKGTGFAFSARQPMRIIEEILVFYREAPDYNPDKIPLDKPYRHTLPINTSESQAKISSGTPAEREYKLYTHRLGNNLLEFPRDNANRGIHSTAKPVKLIEYLLDRYTNPGDTILDSTAG